MVMRRTIARCQEHKTSSSWSWKFFARCRIPTQLSARGKSVASAEIGLLTSRIPNKPLVDKGFILSIRSILTESCPLHLRPENSVPVLSSPYPSKGFPDFFVFLPESNGLLFVVEAGLESNGPLLPPLGCLPLTGW